jgi:hypothetical protein
MLSTAFPGSCVKVAVTSASPLIATWQSAVPEQAPPQPAKVAPAEGAAVSVTAWLKEAEQVAPQSMPAGAEVTLPSPETCTLSACADGCPDPEPSSRECPPQAIRAKTAATNRRHTTASFQAPQI